MPVVYTDGRRSDPAVLRRVPRAAGTYLSIDHPEEIAESFDTFGLGPDDVDLILCTDAEGILGIGDWGVGGIQIAVGKLALYTAGGGIDPRRTIAVSLDVGTDNEQLLNDPFYVGNRHARCRGAEYDDSSRTTLNRPIGCSRMRCCISRTSDPGMRASSSISTRSDYCVYNYDVQGTGAVMMAALYSGTKVTDIPMRDQKMVVFGAGTAGTGTADQFRYAMVADGAIVEQATSQIWPMDKQGLLFDDMDDLRDFQVPYARNRLQLGVGAGDRMGLLDTIKMASPTILVGAHRCPARSPAR